MIGPGGPLEEQGVAVADIAPVLADVETRSLVAGVLVVEHPARIDVAPAEAPEHHPPDVPAHRAETASVSLDVVDRDEAADRSPGSGPVAAIRARELLGVEHGLGAAADRETRLRRAAGGDRYGLRVRPVNRAVPRDAAELHRVTPGRQTGKRHASGDPNGPTRATVY